MTTDPRDLLGRAPMSWLQLAVVAIVVCLNALDGFDVMSISFASPGIAQEWGVDRAALGIVLSMELIGMSIGSILLGSVADRIGRRPTMLGCLIIMVIGMFMATTVRSVYDLSLWRVVTGVGIGGMLAATNAVAAEFSNTRRRNLCISIMVIGYPLGAVIGGLFIADLLKTHSWRSVFYFGAAATAAFIPLVYFLVPESVQWLARRQPVGALEKINRTLKQMGHAALEALPVVTPEQRRRSFSDLFSPQLIAATVLVTAAYFFHITTFYYILKWVPKIVVDMGFAASSAAGVLVWANLGGATGGALFGVLTQKYNIRLMTIAVLLLSVVMVVLFGRSPADLQRLSMICFVAGFCTNAGVVGLYAILALVFPTHARASGTGFAIGVGRGGAVIAPMLAGFLFAGGFGLPTVSMVMALGSFFAAIMLLLLKYRVNQHEQEAEPATTIKQTATTG